MSVLSIFLLSTNRKGVSGPAKSGKVWEKAGRSAGKCDESAARDWESVGRERSESVVRAL